MHYAKKLIVPTLCVLFGCAGGAAMGNVTAQTWPEPANVQRWQHECVEVDFTRHNPAGQTTEALRSHGAAGWELATAAISNTYTLYCFKRPAP